MIDTGKRVWIGVGLLIALSALPATLLIGETPRLPLSPQNAWLKPAMLAVLGGGLAVSLVLLLRGIPLAYPLWAHTVLSYFVFAAYYGFLRREDSFRCCRDPDDRMLEAPMAAWEGILALTLIALAIGYLPLVVRALARRTKARKSRSA